MPNKSVLFQAADGSNVTVQAIDTGASDGRGNQIYRLATDPRPATSLGVGGARFNSADASAAAVAVTDAPGVNLKLVVTDLIISVGSALTVTFTEETSGAIKLVLIMAANSTVILPMTGKLKLAVANKKLMVQTSGAGQINVSALWYVEP